ncbi:MAG: PilX N-terminal domain-containing pilus assembly protein [Cocleimonas sp.]
MKLPQKQSGAVLVIGMIMLAVLSFIVISASQNTAIQQKMTANLTAKQTVLEMAESSLKEAEAYLLKTDEKALLVKFNDTAGHYIFDKNRRLNKASNNWQDLEVIKAQSSATYIIELMPDIKTAGNSLDVSNALSSKFYRITTIAKGNIGLSKTILQSIIKK